MFLVTVDGKTQNWLTLEYALADAMARTLGDKGWVIEKTMDDGE